MKDTDAWQHEMDLQRWDDDGGAQLPAPLEKLSAKEPPVKKTKVVSSRKLGKRPRRPRGTPKQGR